MLAGTIGGKLPPAKSISRFNDTHPLTAVVINPLTRPGWDVPTLGFPLGSRRCPFGRSMSGQTIGCSGLDRSPSGGLCASVPLLAQSEPEASHKPRCYLSHEQTSRGKNPCWYCNANCAQLTPSPSPQNPSPPNCTGSGTKQGWRAVTGTFWCGCRSALSGAVVRQHFIFQDVEVLHNLISPVALGDPQPPSWANFFEDI